MNRRQFLAGSAAVTGSLALGGTSRASVSGVDRRFLFVFCTGGWDTTRVFAPEFDNRNVDMERNAEPWQIGNLQLVDSGQRPAVRSFFEEHYRSIAVIDGLLVPSVAHETCAQIMMTGGTRGSPDWAALLAGLQADRFVLPNLVVDAPSFPAQFGIAVARSGQNGQLDGLVNGSLLEADDRGLRLPDRNVQGAVDRYVGRRAAASVIGARSDVRRATMTSYAEAVRRATDLKDARYATTFGGGEGLVGKLGVAVEALSTGLSRCVSLSFPDAYYSWDSHTNNDAAQTVLWDQLFSGLSELRTMLATTPAPSGNPLSDEVVVVVMSEMGRTPQLNGTNGKDHWPYTSAMLWGAGIVGDRQIGDFNRLFQGSNVDLGSGELAGSGVVPTAAHLGATLLAVADEDPAAWVPGYDPVGALVG